MTFAVSSKAVIARINRVLRQSSSSLLVRRCSERSRAFDTLGRYHILDIARNVVVDPNCDLEQIAMEYGVLADWESVESDS